MNLRPNVVVDGPVLQIEQDEPPLTIPLAEGRRRPTRDHTSRWEVLAIFAISLVLSIALFHKVGMALQHTDRRRRRCRRVHVVPCLGAVRDRPRAGPARKQLRQLPRWRQPDVEHIGSPAELFDGAGDCDIRCRVLLQRSGHPRTGAQRHLRLRGVPPLDRPAAGALRGLSVRVFALHRLPVCRPSGPDIAPERTVDAHRARPPCRGPVEKAVGRRPSPRAPRLGAAPHREKRSSPWRRLRRLLR